MLSCQHKCFGGIALPPYRRAHQNRYIRKTVQLINFLTVQLKLPCNKLSEDIFKSREQFISEFVCVDLC